MYTLLTLDQQLSFIGFVHSPVMVSQYNDIVIRGYWAGQFSGDLQKEQAFGSIRLFKCVWVV